jgi:hypothetical protein
VKSLLTISEMRKEIEREAMAPLPSEPFEYAEWKTAKVHPDYRMESTRRFTRCRTG